MKIKLSILFTLLTHIVENYLNEFLSFVLEANYTDLYIIVVKFYYRL